MIDWATIFPVSLKMCSIWSQEWIWDSIGIQSMELHWEYNHLLQLKKTEEKCYINDDERILVWFFEVLKVTRQFFPLHC